MDDPIVQQAIRDDIPVVLNYTYGQLIGGMTINSDGTATVKFTDPRVLSLIKADKTYLVRAASLSYRSLLRRI